LLHAFDDPEVIAGQATVAAEILQLAPDVWAGVLPDVVVVPVGGGGLAAGMGSLLRRRGVRIVGAQVAGVDGLRRALRGDRPLPGTAPATLADGLRVTVPGVLPLAIASRALDDVVLVSEDEVAAAVGELARAERIVVEGAAAVAAAALARVAGRRRVAVMTGGNIDAPVLAALLARAA
jgi:threonine dehydratase